MRTLIILSLATAALAGAAIADTPNTAAPRGERVVMSCDRDAATRRSYEREYGAEPTYVTAEQVMVARQRGETWSAPRCMAPREHARLVRMLKRD